MGNTNTTANNIKHEKEPISQGITTKIKATSGLSFEYKGRWYKLAYEEERILPEGADKEKEIALLFDHCNQVVDERVEEVYETYKK